MTESMTDEACVSDVGRERASRPTSSRLSLTTPGRYVSTPLHGGWSQPHGDGGLPAEVLGPGVR